MQHKTKLVRDGNSWAIRIPKAALETSGLKPGDTLDLIAKSGRISLYSPAAAKKAAGQDMYALAKQDAREAWDAAFEQVWLDIFGIEE